MLVRNAWLNPFAGIVVARANGRGEGNKGGGEKADAGAGAGESLGDEGALEGR